MWLNAIGVHVWAFLIILVGAGLCVTGYDKVGENLILVGASLFQVSHLPLIGTLANQEAAKTAAVAQEKTAGE
jgi:hypothetical protein